MVTRRDVVRLALALPFAGFARAAAQEKPTLLFYVFGFVRSPGKYIHQEKMTVGDAIEIAGGFTPNRTITGVEIIRIVDGEKKTVGVSLMDAVLANDTILVR